MRFSTPSVVSREDTGLIEQIRHHERADTHPFLLSKRRHKPRRCPLVFRFIKGAIHSEIIIPIICHSIVATAVVCLDKFVFGTLGLPSMIIPSLSIVVGLMLVFRNQTSYNRFWDGRNALQVVNTSIRNLVRAIITSSYNHDGLLSPEEVHDIEQTIRILVAIPYAIKNHLRAEWGAAWILGVAGNDVEGHGGQVYSTFYDSLLPARLKGCEQDGLGFPYQLTFLVDNFISRGLERGWYSAPGGSSMQTQLSTLTDAFGKMETIWLTPIPIAHQIHQKQVLALFGCVLPFSMVDDLGWWTVPIVTLVTFTLYGIEGIGSQLEDPFGYDRNDINMDAICQDLNIEVEAILTEWRRVKAAAEGAVAVVITTEDVTTSKSGDITTTTTAQKAPIRKFDPGEMFLKSPSPAPSVVINEF
ncbi:Bestrophin, RFP-TM, chloride channel domain containing protein [Elaphomyces granulatus]